MINQRCFRLWLDAKESIIRTNGGVIYGWIYESAALVEWKLTKDLSMDVRQSSARKLSVCPIISTNLFSLQWRYMNIPASQITAVRLYVKQLVQACEPSKLTNTEIFLRYMFRDYIGIPVHNCCWCCRYKYIEGFCVQRPRATLHNDDGVMR